MAQFEGEAVVLRGVLLGRFVSRTGEGRELVRRRGAARSGQVENGTRRFIVCRVGVVRLGCGESLLVRFWGALRWRRRRRRGGNRGRRRGRRGKQSVARKLTPLGDAKDLVTRGQSREDLVDADEGLAADAVLLLDGVELRLQHVVLLGELHDALL